MSIPLPNINHRLEIEMFSCKAGQAFIDKGWDEGDIANVIIIKEGYEETKNKPSNNDYVLVDICEPRNIEYGYDVYRENKKMVENTWLSIGISDWDAEEVTIEEAHRAMIKSVLEVKF